MNYPTLEALDDKVNHLNEAICQIIHKEYFFLSRQDMEDIEKGNAEYDSAKTVSGKILKEKLKDAF